MVIYAYLDTVAVGPAHRRVWSRSPSARRCTSLLINAERFLVASRCFSFVGSDAYSIVTLIVSTILNAFVISFVGSSVDSIIDSLVVSILNLIIRVLIRLLVRLLVRL